MHDQPADSFLTYEDLAALIEERLGERPTLSALRSETARPRPTARVSVTAGLPRPSQPGRNPSRPTLFSRPEVLEWLEHHPRRRLEQLAAALEATEPGPDRDELILTARRQAMSWKRIAAALSRRPGETYTAQGLQQRLSRQQ